MSEYSLYLFVCPSCLEIPFVTILLSKTIPFLKISCKCGINRIIHFLNIPSYLKSISSYKDVIDPLINKHLTCSIHSNIKTLYYCNSCNMEYCCHCKSKHSTHQTIFISEEKSAFNCIDVISKYKQRKSEMVTYYKNLYEKFINCKENSKNIQLQEMYYKHIEINRYLDKYIQATLLNYITYKGKDNYYVPIANIKNLKFNNIDVELKTIEMNANGDIENKTIEHLYNSYILKLDEMNLSFNDMNVQLEKVFTNENEIIIKLIEIPNERILAIQNNSDMIIYNQHNFQNVLTVKSQSKIYDIIHYSYNLIITTHSFGTISIWTLSPTSLRIKTTCTLHNNSLPIIIIKQIYHTNTFITTDTKEINIWKINDWDLLISKISSIIIVSQLCTLEVVNQVIYACTNEKCLYIIENGGYSECKLKYELNGCGCVMKNCIKAWKEEFVIVVNVNYENIYVVNINNGCVEKNIAIESKKKMENRIFMVLPVNDEDFIFTRKRYIKYMNVNNEIKGSFAFEKEERCVDMIQLKSGGLACVLNNKICILY